MYLFFPARNINIFRGASRGAAVNNSSDVMLDLSFLADIFLFVSLFGAFRQIRFRDYIHYQSLFSRQMKNALHCLADNDCLINISNKNFNIYESRTFSARSQKRFIVFH